MRPNREPDLRVLNLGAGVQSTTVLLMALEGELPRPDVAVFADTGWEPAEVYEHLTELEARAARDGLEIVRVAAGDLRADALDPEHRFASMPLFVRNLDGSQGMLKRQCTNEYKIEPIRREVIRRLGLGYRKKLSEQWFGISADEIGRVKSPRTNYLRHFYPLLNITVERNPNDPRQPIVNMDDGRGRRMTRQDCFRWLEAHNETAPRSACIGCPFRTDREWRTIRDNPEQWADVVAFDEAIRDGKLNSGKAPLLGSAYLHGSLRPLAEVDFATEEDRGQGNLFGNECEGMCGV